MARGGCLWAPALPVIGERVLLPAERRTEALDNRALNGGFELLGETQPWTLYERDPEGKVSGAAIEERSDDWAREGSYSGRLTATIAGDMDDGALALTNWAPAYQMDLSGFPVGQWFYFAGDLNVVSLAGGWLWMGFDFYDEADNWLWGTYAKGRSVLGEQRIEGWARKGAAEVVGGDVYPFWQSPLTPGEVAGPGSVDMYADRMVVSPVSDLGVYAV